MGKSTKCLAEMTMKWLEIESCERCEASNHRQHLNPELLYRYAIEETDGTRMVLS